jgi:hypothetical protein
MTEFLPAEKTPTASSSSAAPLPTYIPGASPKPKAMPPTLLAPQPKTVAAHPKSAASLPVRSVGQLRSQSSAGVSSEQDDTRPDFCLANAKACSPLVFFSCFM